jgi:hypothetical protein
MPSYNLVALIGLSVLVASTGARPPPAHNDGPSAFDGPFNGPPRGHHPPGTVVGPIPSGPTGSSGGPIFPTGAFPTGVIPSGIATNGLPVLPTPTDSAGDLALVKRFEGPRGDGPGKPWHHYKPRPSKPSGPIEAPRPPPFATGGPVLSGTQDPPILGPTGGPPAGPTAY